MTKAQRQLEEQRAATATQPPAGTFTVFSKLAPELQLEVWDQAVSVPRMLIIQLRSCGCGGDFHFTLDENNISPPRELRTCLNSHRIASKKYKPLFAASIFDNHVSHHQYVSGDQFSSYLGMSKEEFLLRHYPLLFSLDISALKTCLGSSKSRSLPEEVIANSPLTNRPPPPTRLENPRPKVPFSSVDTLYIVEADDHQFLQPKLRLFPHDISTQPLHYVAFDAELLRWYSSREFIWCFVWACNLQEVVLVQRIRHPTRTGPQDKFDFVNIRNSEVDPLIREKLETFIRDEVSTPPPKEMFEMYFGQEIKPRDRASFKAPTFKLMGITKGGERL
jgi:hypothetical protein